VPTTPPDYSALAGYYAQVADEFLQSYFVLGLNGVRLHARYFVMAHCLELAFKAALAHRAVPIRYNTHDLDYLESELLRQGDTELKALQPDAAAKEVFGRMFNRSVSNFIMQDWLDHREALELLLCYEHSADLKYGVDRGGQHILAVTPSSVTMNTTFLLYIAHARRRFPDRGEEGRAIVDFIADVERQFPTQFSGASRIFA
jgi:hypothetical protein